MATRTERRERVKDRRKRLTLTAAAVAAALVLAGASVAAVALTRGGSEDEVASSGTLPVAASTITQSSAPVEATPQIAEVPDVVGRPLVEAEMMLSLAGFDVRRTEVATAEPSADRVVVYQTPAAGERLDAGSVVVLGHALEPRSAPAVPRGRFVVCIDPGHQARSDDALEPVGPGSKERKARVKGGATGVSTRIPEYETVLRISERTKARLEAAGVRVIMTRTSNDVNLSNAERAAVANKAGADLFVRVHCDSSVDRSVAGASTLYPDENTWTRPIIARSRRAATAVQQALVASTGAEDRGIVDRGDITGFNWSKVPAILVECGFLSNPTEDKLLASSPYQDRVAEGIAQGVLAYLRE